MDIRCTVCGEPWDFDSIHDRVEELNPNKPWYVDGEYDDKIYQQYYQPAKKEFQRKGCSFFGCPHNEKPIGNVYAIRELTEVFGDDMDGLAAMIEDFGL